MRIKKRRAYSQLSTLQQTVKYLTRPLLVLLGLKLLAFKASGWALKLRTVGNNFF